MIDRETCEMIIEKFYDDVYKFCFMRLGSSHGAEDCTQEVFVILFSKRSKLDFSERFRAWLYSTADKVCKKYMRKNPVNADIDELAEIIPDGRVEERDITGEICEILGESDGRLLIEYLEADHGRRADIAARLKITQKALYRRMDRLREKVKKALDEKNSE